jgi:hypothetical protein
VLCPAATVESETFAFPVIQALYGNSRVESKPLMSTSSSSGHRNLQLPAAEHSGICGAIIENPCGVSFITPHGFVFPIVRSVAHGESN